VPAISSVALEAQTVVRATRSLSEQLRRSIADAIVSNAARIRDFSLRRDEYMAVHEGKLFAYTLGLHMLFAGLGKNRPQHEIDALTDAVALELAQAGYKSVTPAFVREAQSRVNQTVGSGVKGQLAGDEKIMFDAMMLHMIESFPGTAGLLQIDGLGHEVFRRFGTMSIAASGAVPGPATAGPLESARAAMLRGDYATAIKLLRPLADQGDASAQGCLGLIYADRGVLQDEVQAVAWFRKAAGQGDVGAQFGLGLMYINGRGVPQDFVEAAALFREAADQGDAGSQFNLGLMYIEGQGVPRDQIQAHKWLNLSTSRFDAADNKRRDKAVQFRDSVAAKMTAAQIAEAESLAREWKAK